MLKMRNNIGNIVVEIKTTRQCEDLKRCGYIAVEENPDIDKMKTEELEAFAKKRE